MQATSQLACPTAVKHALFIRYLERAASKFHFPRSLRFIGFGDRRSLNRSKENENVMNHNHGDNTDKM